MSEIIYKKTSMIYFDIQYIVTLVIWSPKPIAYFCHFEKIINAFCKPVIRVANLNCDEFNFNDVMSCAMRVWSFSLKRHDKALFQYDTQVGAWLFINADFVVFLYF